MSTLSQQLINAYVATRARTEALAAPLSAEDQLLQSMPDCSPTKWHRAHTTWFFETFVLGAVDMPPLRSQDTFLWNSYYEAIGARHPRPQRGLLSRPSLSEVAAYRETTDARVIALLGEADEGLVARLAPVLTLGLAHEQQHQELILTDILHAFSCHPFEPIYAPSQGFAHAASPPAPQAETFTEHGGGLVEIGHAGPAFAFDNKKPRHKI